ncbi:MAG TPA: amino acid racemase [Myxococcota bacterium]|nr:amino acid racemase [Myxococcota bacterium]
MSGTKHIGIVAVSAEGAALCYRTICAEGAAVLGPHDHPEVSVHTFPLARYMALIARDRWDEAGELLLESAGILVRGGAELLVCPDNTLHQALDRVRERAPAPWLHIAEEVAAAARARGLRRLGVLGTRHLMEGAVYREKLAAHGIACEIPEPAERARANAVIFDELVCGRFDAGSRRYFCELIESLGQRGCDAVVLGCTEIPLLVSDADSSLPVLDSTRILARAALREALGQD